MAHFSLSTEFSKKIEKCHAEMEMLDKKLGKLYFDCLVILVYLLLAEADWWQETRTLLSVRLGSATDSQCQNDQVSHLLGSDNVYIFHSGSESL